MVQEKPLPPIRCCQKSFIVRSSSMLMKLLVDSLLLILKALPLRQAD